MPKYGHPKRHLVTWAEYSMLIGRDQFCFAVIGQSLLEPLSLLASKTKKKGEAETKSGDWDLKNALTNTNLRTVKRYEVGMCIGLFSFLNIVMYRFSQG